MYSGRSRLPLGWPAVMVAAALSWCVLSSCNFADPFAAYTGVNFIAGSDFSSSDWTLVDQSLTPLANPSPYLTFAAVTATVAGTTNGLPSGALDYSLLEIPNLVQDGDFTNSLPGTSWSSTGGASYSVVVPSAPGLIDGNSLNFVIPAGSGGATVRYDLATLADYASSFPAGAQYRILFSADTLNSNPGTFEYDNGTTALGGSPWTVNFGSVAPGTYSSPVSFPPSGIVSEITPPSTGNAYFSIGAISASTSAGQTGYIDNLRITRVDVEPYLYLPVPYGSTTSSRPAFISGTYQFSVYAKLETSTQVTPNVANAFDADGITLGIENARAEFPASALSRTQWKKLSVKKTIQVGASPSPTDIAMELFVAPTDLSNRDVGGLLISSPSLTFLPNG